MSRPDDDGIHVRDSNEEKVPEQKPSSVIKENKDKMLRRERNEVQNDV